MKKKKIVFEMIDSCVYYSNRLGLVEEVKLLQHGKYRFKIWRETCP